jgi:hypothetical protein
MENRKYLILTDKTLVDYVDIFNLLITFEMSTVYPNGQKIKNVNIMHKWLRGK